MIKFKKRAKKQSLIDTAASAIGASLRRRNRHEGIQAVLGTPSGLSWKEWKAVLSETKSAASDKNLPSLAAGAAYYSTLALFPMLAAGVAIAALVITNDQLNSILLTARTHLPEDVSNVIGSQLQSLVSRRTDNILVAALAVGVALFGASGASKNLIIASNAAYGVKESRGWLAQQLWGVIWTLVGIVFGFLVVGLLAVNETSFTYLGISSSLISWVLYGRWLLILLLAFAGLSLFYRYGPDRHRTQWRWILWGAAIATAAWLVATILFFVYVQYFANYNQSYSLFAGIIVLMIWMNLSALIVLLGAEINHRLESAGRHKWGHRL